MLVVFWHCKEVFGKPGFGMAGMERRGKSWQGQAREERCGRHGKFRPVKEGWGWFRRVKTGGVGYGDAGRGAAWHG